MKNSHDDIVKLYEEMSIQRKMAESCSDIQAKAKYHNQIADWLEELEERRNDYEKIEYYGENGTTDNIKEYKKLCKDLEKERKKNKGEESNVECLIIDKITELISKMKLKEVRELKLFQLH